VVASFAMMMLFFGATATKNDLSFVGLVNEDLSGFTINDRHNMIGCFTLGAGSFGMLHFIII
jgi:hypothetical protein